jgi:ornithine carbamoyltransferase
MAGAAHPALRDRAAPVVTATTTVRWPGHLLRAADLTRLALDELLSLAARMKAEPGPWTGALAGASLGCVHEAPTIGEGLPAHAAAHRLGMLPIVVSPQQLREADDELLADAARVLSGYVAAVLAEDVPDLTLGRLARAGGVPILNARSPEHRPVPALADLLTLREHFGGLEGRVLACVGAAAGSARSLLTFGAMSGMEVRVAAPPELAPSREDLAAAEVLADLHGGKVSLTQAPPAAVTGADAVLTGPWPPAADPVERAQLEDRLAPYRVTPPLFARAKGTAIFLADLPVHRGQEVSAAVLDGPHAVVWEQAANRLPAAQAVIYAFSTGDRER